jgi:hypothetical protein
MMEGCPDRLLLSPLARFLSGNLLLWRCLSEGENG